MNRHFHFRHLSYLLTALIVFLFCNEASADTFGSGANAFDIQFVTIGNPNNPADTTGDPNPAGSVPYVYRIGKYEISEQMIDKANALGGLGLTKDTRGPDKPATSLSWFEAAKIVNWLNTSTGSVPAYKFDAGGNFQLWSPTDNGYDASNLFRNTQARYFLPSADEWYKAAFYDPAISGYWDYPTASNNPPVSVAFGTTPGTAVYAQPFAQGPADIMLAGGGSPYGTFAQAGNVWEWEETEIDLVNDDSLAVRGLRGGAWPHGPVDISSAFRHNILVPGNSSGDLGFRIVSIVPEPSSLYLMFVGLLTAFLRYRYSSLRSAN